MFKAGPNYLPITFDAEFAQNYFKCDLTILEGKKLMIRCADLWDDFLPLKVYFETIEFWLAQQRRSTNIVKCTIEIENIVNGLLQCDQMLDKKVAQFSQKLPEIVTTVIDSEVRFFKISSISWQTFWLLLCENWSPWPVENGQIWSHWNGRNS